MEEKAKPKPKEPRAVEEIFGDLRQLTQSDGALHEISAIVYRDCVVTIDVQEGRVVDDPEYRWSTSKLNKNELMLLLGLMVQSESERIYTVRVPDNDFSERADQLLREFHDRLVADCGRPFDPEGSSFADGTDTFGPMAREAIYYGADSFYLHQFYGFCRNRYREDFTWLLQNEGLSIRPMIEIARFIVNRVSGQITAVGHMRKEGHEFSHGDLTDSLIISKSDIRKEFGQRADAFIARFSTPAVGANTGFVSPFAINAVHIAPIIDFGEYLYVPNQYRVLESLYESPSYWMMGDESYTDTAAGHRGDFLEKTAAHIFRTVFGPENVYENVTIGKSKRTTDGEVDVLVAYGEFVLVVQAKSKRVTMNARAGDTEALRQDFDGAIQAPYRQALKCAELIRDGAECITKDGKVLSFPSLPRLFPVVVLSDPFPGSTFLSRALLERGKDIAPVIWDIAVLDCVARLLPTPIEMIFYLKSRSDVFDNVISDSEYNYLGCHIGAKLVLPPDVDVMMLDRDFAAVVDDYMISRDVGVEPERPAGILERLEIPVVSELLAELKNADPRVAAVVIDLYDFSKAALEDLSTQILSVREEVSGGKAIKALSVPTPSGGITYAVTRDRSAKARAASEAIGSKHKYDTKSDRWYVIVDCVGTRNPVDWLSSLVWPWEENEEAAEASRQVAEMFGSRREAVTPGRRRT